MSTRPIITEGSNTVNRLVTALSGTLLEVIGESATITVVSHIRGDSIGPAPPVLVVSRVMVAALIRVPVTNTVNRLRAGVRGTASLAFGMRTRLAVLISSNSHSVHLAALVLVTIRHMSTSTMHTPLALTVHRLATSRCGALLQLVSMRTGKAAMESRLADAVDAAPLVLMIVFVIEALIIVTPGAHTVNGLCAGLGGALLEVMLVCASIAIVGRAGADLEEPALPVLMI